MKLRNPSQFQQGYRLERFALPAEFRAWVEASDWDRVDSEFRKLVQPGASFFQFLAQYCDFQSIEFILSIRDSQNEWEEDGIWHDDGSRVFAFSLSITPDADQVHGILEFRMKQAEELIASIPTPAFGTAILFLTGIYGYEHRTRQVTQGRRIILAGWCS